MCSLPEAERRSEVVWQSHLGMKVLLHNPSWECAHPLVSCRYVHVLALEHWRRVARPAESGLSIAAPSRPPCSGDVGH